MPTKILSSRQEAKLNMYRTVEAVCRDNISIVESNKAFENAYNQFKAFIPLIDADAQTSGAVITGIAADKKVSKASLCAAAAPVGSLIYAYAAANGNNELKQAVNFSKSDLMKIKDAELAPVCRNIHQAGQTNLPALGDYGVTAEMLAALQTQIESFAQTVVRPRVAIANRSVVKASLRDYFKQADQILNERMDKLIEAFKPANPDFVAAYKAARIIVDPKSKPKTNGENGGG